MNYATVYEKWDTLPDAKISLADSDGGSEGIWVKELPDGSAGLNNNPLADGYRWQGQDFTFEKFAMAFAHDG